ncbi:MAG: peptide ABC transporter substrate-binding protein [Oscillospiraceae bacterium]|jgi:ABC-type oligopeptide transport system substrate-binding subunit|nr:peptide ABC transporter substrate-binding protein [Oscillospiraceae bacterium]
MKSTVLARNALYLLLALALVAVAQPAAHAAADEKVLNIAITAEPSSLDPNNGIGDTWMFTNGHLYEPVTRLDINNDAVPGSALSWELSEDGLTYTFIIRDDNGWSNGAKATAYDYEYGVKRILTHESGEDWASLVFDIKNASKVFAGELPVEEAGIKADGNILTITLEQPEPYFPKLLTFAPYFGVNTDFVEGTDGKYGTQAALTLSNGPYYVESWAHDDKLVFRKNPYYWNAANVKIDTINIYIIPDENTRINLFQNGELDYVEFSGAKKPVVEQAGYAVSSYENGRSVYLDANLSNPVSGNLKIRQALSSAIDRELFVKGALKDASTPAEGLVPTGITGADGKSFREYIGKTLIYDYNPELAQTLFAEGLAELGLAASDVTLTIISRNSEPYVTANAALQEIFQETFGIKVSTEPLDRSSYSARRSDYSYDFCLVSWGADWDDATTLIHYFYETEPTDTARVVYKEAAFDEPYAKALLERDPALRQTYLGEAEAALMEALPRIPIWAEGQYKAVSDRLLGVHNRAVVPYVDIVWADIAE